MKKENEILYEMKVGILKALANVTRLRIAEFLLDRESSVNDIVSAMGIERTGVSKHLASLQKANILKSRREGTTVFYSLKIPCILNVFGCIEDVLNEQVRANMSLYMRIGKRRSRGRIGAGR